MLLKVEVGEGEEEEEAVLLLLKEEEVVNMELLFLEEVLLFPMKEIEVPEPHFLEIVVVLSLLGSALVEVEVVVIL